MNKIASIRSKFVSIFIIICMLCNMSIYVYANPTLEGGTDPDTAAEITNYPENITIKGADLNQGIYKFISPISGSCTITMQNPGVKWHFYIYDKDSNIIEEGQAITAVVNPEKQTQAINITIGNLTMNDPYYLEIANTDNIGTFVSDIYISVLQPQTYAVTYNGNGNTGGNAPTDGSSPYVQGSTVTVLGNSGTLVRTGYTFAGWNTQADGNGISYTATDTFAMGSSNVTLYAKWTANPTYTVTYSGNSNTGGAAPTDGNSPYVQGDSVTVLGNTGSLVRTGYTFAGWNTQADGNGTSYTAAGTFAMGSSNVILYAKWTANPTYTVTYNGNGNTGGNAPTDGSSPYLQGDTVTVLGNTGSLVRTGYTFAGWNTQADGNGTSYTAAGTFAMGSSNVILYAKWTANPTYTVTYNGNGNTGGNVPTDGNSYLQGDTVIVLGNSGSLVKVGYTFAGWNTQADGNGTTYTAAGTFAMGNSNVILYAKWTENSTYAVTYNGNSNTGGSAPIDGNSPYVQGSTVTVLGNTGTLVRTGYTFAGWNTQADGNGTSYTAAGTFAMGSSNVILYAKWTANSGGGSTGGGGGGTTPTTPTTPKPNTPSTGVDILVNGKTETAATSETKTVDNKVVTNVTVDANKVEAKLKSEGNNSVITIPVSGNSDVVVGTLNGQTVKNMETKESVLEIKTDSVVYTLPASQINIDAVSDNLGNNIKLSDINVNVTIADASTNTIKMIEDKVNAGQFTTVVKPVDFTINCTYAGKTVEVSKFNSYIERSIAIPDGIDPSKITTGVVIEPNGSVRHVPTKVTNINDKYYAVINSLTNSSYTVVWHPIEFADVSKHWSKEAVDDMASRMIAIGRTDSKYDPNTDITRGEFAAFMANALGLGEHNKPNKFKDIETTKWYYNGVQIASEYGIISGYEDGTFRPDAKITREEAMSIIARAMKYTKLDASSNKTALKGYKDASKVSDYAKDSVTKCIVSGVVTGRKADVLAPKANITRAEAAAIIQKLLKRSDLI